MAADVPMESRPRVSIEHIEIDANGNAKLVGHRIKVKHIVALMQAHGYTAEQLQAEAYPHLSLAQIYAALTYYHDHRDDIDRRMKEESEFAQRELERQRSDPRHQELVTKMNERWRQLHGE